jgi:glycosyltransferase involved in cell wall biosynthesis
MSSTSPHFLVVATEWGSAHGGLSTFNRQLCTHLAAAGVRVSCLVLEASDGDHNDAAAKGVSLVEAPRLSGASAGELLSRRPDLRDAGDPAAIIGHARITGRAAQALHGYFPAAHHVHFIHMIPDDIERHKLDRGDDAEALAEERHQAELELSEAADYAVAVGPRIYAWFLRDLEARGVEPSRLLRFDPGFDAAGAVQRTPPQGEPWMVLLFGRGEDEHLKGFDIAAAGFSAAADRLRHRLPEIELVIRGATRGTSAELAGKARRWASDKGLNVRVKPYATQPARLANELRSASLVVMPSRAEGFGLVGVEAIVAGAPALVSSASGLGKLISEVLPEAAVRTVVETTGDDTATIENWSRAIEAVLSNRNGAFTQAAELQRRLAEKVTWAGSVSALLEALRGIVAPDNGKSVAPAPGTSSRSPMGEELAGYRDLPQRIRGFTGREHLLARVSQALADAPGPVVLHGPGGIGKSSAAVEYAYRSAGEYDLIQVVTAENPGLIPSQLATLGVSLGVASATADTDTTARTTLQVLQRRQRWLLLFDNVEKPDDLLPWLPTGPGHVLVTSRAGGWREFAKPILVEEFRRAESIDLLTRNVAGLTDQDADRLADILGDLPLALAQAAGTLDSGVSAAEFKDLVDVHAEATLGLEPLRSYGKSLAAVTLLATRKLAEAHPAAANLLCLCSYLAPEPIPAGWFQTAPASHAHDADLAPLPWGMLETRQAFTLIRDKGLGKADVNGLRLHRLTQAILRDHTRGHEDAYETLAADILTAAAPQDTDDTAHWSQWSRLTPHILALESHKPTRSALRELVGQVARYLIVSGQSKAAITLTAELHHHRSSQLGPDHPDTLTAAQHYAHALNGTGDYTASYNLGVDTLNRRRQVLGEDHPDTLMSANNLAVKLSVLGRYAEALPLDQDTYDRRRRVLGEDHPDTLMSANNLAAALRGVERTKDALPLIQDTYDRSRRVLGEDHPDTLTSAHSLAITLRLAGRGKDALPLIQDTYDRSRRVLGEDHPGTLAIASNLSGVLNQMGRATDALLLSQDTYDRSRRVLGEDHPDTLSVANNLSGVLNQMGRATDALLLSQDTYDRSRRVLGEDHPNTLTSANNLAVDLGGVGRVKDALTLAQDAYDRRRRVLGESHADTLMSAKSLANLLRASGHFKAAAVIESRIPKRGKTNKRRRK